VPPVLPTKTPWDAIDNKIVEISLADELVKEYRAHGLDLFLCEGLRNAIFGTPPGIQIHLETSGSELMMLVAGMKLEQRPKPLSASKAINEITFNATQISGDPARNTIAGVEEKIRLAKKLAKALERYRNDLYSTKRGSRGREVRKLAAEAALLKAEHYAPDETTLRRRLTRFIRTELKKVKGQKFPASFRSEFSETDKDGAKFTMGTLKAAAMDLITLDPLDEGKMISNSSSNRRLERARKCLCQE
jgi:hypothetical protein